MARFTTSLLLIFISLSTLAQSETINIKGHYAFMPLSGWKARLSDSDSYVYSPPDGAMDPWDEKVEFSVADGEGVELNDAFDFYTKTDFPEAYGKFKLLTQGQEKINGLDAKWATFTFSAQGTAAGSTSSGDSTLSATLQAVFYVIKKGDTLYLANGVAERTLFTKFEPSFRSIIRTFRVKE